MLPNGRFRSAPAGPPLSLRILVGAALVAIVASGLALAALAVSVAAALLPVALLAAVVAWVALRFRRWRAGLGGNRRGTLFR